MAAEPREAKGIAREQGASLAKLMEATDWRRHSVHGFISAAALIASMIKVAA